MIHLIDTLNDRRISSHRSLEAAGRACQKYGRDVKRANGRDSYIPITVLKGGTQATWREEAREISEDERETYILALNEGYH